MFGKGDGRVVLHTWNELREPTSKSCHLSRVSVGKATVPFGAGAGPGPGPPPSLQHAELPSSGTQQGAAQLLTGRKKHGLSELGDIAETKQIMGPDKNNGDSPAKHKP